MHHIVGSTPTPLHHPINITWGKTNVDTYLLATFLLTSFGTYIFSIIEISFSELCHYFDSEFRTAWVLLLNLPLLKHPRILLQRFLYIL